MNPTLSQETLDKLRRFDTPTICNLIELFDVRPRDTGFMNAAIQACFPDLGPIVGYAATATFRASLPPRKGDVYSTLDKQVARFPELSGPPIVVFQDLDLPVVAATFGEVMCTTYQAFGAQGLITSGAGATSTRCTSSAFLSLRAERSARMAIRFSPTCTSPCMWEALRSIRTTSSTPTGMA